MLFQLEKTKLIEVAVPLPVADPFTYAVPDEWVSQAEPGMRVLVPFKNRELVGYVVGAQEAIPPERTKKAIRLLDSAPILNDHFLRLTAWLKDYYFSSWGEAIQAVLPKMYRQKKDTKYREKSVLEEALGEAKRNTLNSEQAIAVQKITECLKTEEHHRILLFGVTGSGKSEVYIRAIQETLRMNKQAICLVPEIALTEQLKHFFESHFGGELEIVHSKLSDGERWQAWDRIRRGEKSIVLGARSAVFSPLQNLGLIIMDEEQEPSYKQDQTPRYHAREVAHWRTRDCKAIFLMGTATPSLETMQEAEDGKMLRMDLTKRIDAKKLPTIEIVDLNQAQNISRERVVISSKLQMTIENALQKKEGILLLLNRRGFSTQAQCLNCKQLVACRHCDVALTFHQSERKLICHYCNYTIDDPQNCPECKHPLLKFTGIGTERVESEAARLFPSARIARLDSDSARRRGSHQRILSKFRAQEIDILVGTQMIAKGFDFPQVTVVGVILADTALLLPDFRSSEKTFQLLTQVAGRSGRGSGEGHVIIQTYSPFHFSIQHAKDHNVTGFFSEEIKHRESFQYPPFTQLINVMFRGKLEAKVVEQASELKTALSRAGGIENVEIIGPAPLPFRKLRGNYRWHMIVKSRLKDESMRRILRRSLKEARRVSHVHMAIDVDPLAIL